MRLDTKALGLAGGTLWGAVILILTLVSLGNGYGESVLRLLLDIYPGYSISGTGAVVGLVWGFIDGFIGCYLFAWLYNRFAK